ncbi:MAG: flagellar basal body rod protein FlgB [Gemmatimonadales bacterium]|nr:flagellar basal body rod protein FlgB [Gemmatimonadales bacterium]
MIKTGLFDQSHLSTLKKAVDVYASRHKVTAENIANIETRGYRSQKLVFEEMLNGADSRLQGAKTQPGHLSLGRSEIGSTEYEVKDSASQFDNGVNNVDIDNEMTDLATNDLTYRLATRLLSMRYTMLRGGIKGTMR